MAPLCVKVTLNDAPAPAVFAAGALTVMVNVPVCVGVPESTPLLPSVRPAGSEPLASEKVVVPMPPLCVKVWLNTAPATPLVTAGFVTVMVWQVIVSVYVGPVPLQPFESVALTVIGKLPVCVGVPERTPFDASVKPAGNVPPASENVVVPTPPLCVKVWLNAAPATPLFTAGLVTVMVGHVICSGYVGPTPVQPCESVTMTVIGKLPVTVGVPERPPVDANARPEG